MPDSAVLAKVRPPDWPSPTPAALYDLVVLGGGTAGLVSAVGAASLGARVALVERACLGGDCLMSGCVPSKAILHSARLVDDLRGAAVRGLEGEWRVDFPAVMERMRRRRAHLADRDSADRLARLGVDVFFGNGAFRDERAIAVGERLLRFRRAVVTTGSRPHEPDIPGLQDVAFLTTDSVFDLKEAPARLAVLGAGAVGCELAQAFALLGSSVTLVEKAPRILPNEDPDAAAVLAGSLVASGVTVRASFWIDRIEQRGGMVRAVGGAETIDCDAVLLAVGRRPNVEGLGLESAGIAVGEHGVAVDEYLRTTNRRVFAAGDVCSAVRFTHAADAAARVVLRNALFPFGRARVDANAIPRCVFTVPEVAHVGEGGALAPDQAAIITVPLEDIDRAVLDDATQGFVRLHHRRGRLVGATVVAPHAGELIGFLGLCVRRRMTLAELSSTVFPYPTVSEALRKAADMHRRTALTPTARAVLGRYFSVSRRG